MEKIILDLCGGTGAWSKPYAEARYDVRNITLPDFDVRMFKAPKNVYGILAAPPCTVFARSGTYKKRTIQEYTEALSVVGACIRIVFAAKPHFWALENPSGRLQQWLGEPRLKFQPCDFSEPYTKLTYLWGDFNIPRFNRIIPREGSITNWKIRKSCERAITPRGFAKAFFEANQ